MRARRTGIARLYWGALLFVAGFIGETVLLSISCSANSVWSILHEVGNLLASGLIYVSVFVVLYGVKLAFGENAAKKAWARFLAAVLSGVAVFLTVVCWQYPGVLVVGAFGLAIVVYAYVRWLRLGAKLPF